MGYSLKEDEYYLIKQIIEDKKTTQFELEKTNEESVIKFTRLMAGTVCVYKYNSKTNQRIDLTNELGRPYRPLDEFERIIVLGIKFYSKGRQPISIYNLHVYEHMERELTIWGENYKSFYFTRKFINEIGYYAAKEFFFSCEYKKEEKEKISTIKGNKYEYFIGKKYESINKNVIYNGINKNKNDNGIDLIINEEKKITFVQCKNWKSNEQYKINQKDIRAFIGDCYIYMINNTIQKPFSMHFIVSDENLLTKSAELYIKQNTIVKFKIIPFEEN